MVRERIAVEKTVAEQEENIKRLRVVEEAERTRQAVVIQAEAEAQENLVKDIKAAEAAEAAAKHKAREALVLAEARQQAAELDARAKIRLAEGMQAEAAAEGLAEVQVCERNAAAIEKVGRAEAAVEREKALATADAVREKLKGEAEGLTEKAAAMAALDDATRQHEEYRLRLEAEKEIRLAGIDVQRQVAEAQAEVVSKGLEKANIDIVGGDSVFFDRLLSSISMGKSVDGFVRHSDVAQGLAQPWLDGSSNFTEDLGKLLGKINSADVSNLTLSAFLLQQIRAGASPYLSDTYAAAQPVGTGPLERVGNADLVRGISDSLSIARMVDDMRPSAAVFEALIRACARVFDHYHWLGERELGDLRTPLAEVRATAEQVLDEFEKVQALTDQAASALAESAHKIAALIRLVRGEAPSTTDAWVRQLSQLRRAQGHLVTLREMRYVDTERIDALAADLDTELAATAQRAVGFLQREDAFTGYHDEVDRCRWSRERPHAPGRLTPEQGARWAEVKAAYLRQRALGGDRDDPVSRAVGALGLLTERVGAVERAIERAVERPMDAPGAPHAR